MKYFLSALLFLNIFIVGAMAQENKDVQANSDADKKSISGVTLRPEALDTLRRSKQNLMEAQQEEGFFSENPVNLIPDCQSERLKKAVLNKVKEYQKQYPENSIIGIRQQKLLLKRLREFSKVEIASLNPEKYPKLGDKIITYKINDGIAEKEMRLCKSTEPYNIYLLIYPKGSDYLIDIVDMEKNFPRDLTAVYN